jgi:hypothetical protein
LIESNYSSEKNLEHAFELAHSELKIERLLDIEGINLNYQLKKLTLIYD